jgi:phosphomannomutase
MNLRKDALAICKAALQKENRFKVLFDASGATGGLAVPALEALGVEVLERHTQPDPQNELVADPSDRVGQKRLDEAHLQMRNSGERELIGAQGDGDFDRLGFVDESGRTITAEEMLAATYLRFVLENLPAFRMLRDGGYGIKLGLALDPRASSALEQILGRVIQEEKLESVLEYG